jgi:predicted dehydrogenase
MLEACRRTGVKLLIGHMRRYNRHYMKAKQMIDAGELGRVEMMHAYCGGWDLFLWGTHYADMLRYLNGDVPVEWLMGQITGTYRGQRYPYLELHRDVKGKGSLFVAEDSAVGLMQFANGVRAILECGIHAKRDWIDAETGEPVRRGRCKLSVYGTDGMLTVSDRFLASRTAGGGDNVPRSLGGPGRDDALSVDPFAGEIRELIGSIERNTETQLGGRGGRAALEIILAISESSRRRSIVEFPLETRDNPFLSMVAAGQI